MLSLSKALFVSLISLGLLTACDSGPSQAEILAASKTLQPQDAQLNEIYQRTCKNCHTLADTGAPLTGDVNAWAQRLDKGQEAMINSVIYGSGGMPPFGLCMECGPEEFAKLIEFMAQPGKASK